MRKKTETRNCVERARECVGGDTRGAMMRLAEALDISRQRLNGWRLRGWIPSHFAFEIERVTGAKVTAAEVVDEENRMSPIGTGKKNLRPRRGRAAVDAIEKEVAGS